MTASALLEDRAAAKEAGMTAFLEKPVTLEALVGMLGEGSVGATPASSVG